MKLVRTSFAILLLAVSLVGAAALSRALAAPVAQTGSYATEVRHAAEELSAQAILGTLASRYGYLDGVRVSIGATPNGEEAVAYYESGRIVIDAGHSVRIGRILEHEIWHIIDWREDGSLDWDESVPPANAGEYARS